ncbi:hypothetical protein GG681_11960 [Epibacterium sp. SM1969]|uniref:Uncharacterized protein n=1 Tax=Tritonibacter aquimaris TaxID=2663379 RepID=A0A844AMS5_9RHOB|nr:hypothetical protein [Tritonibacter aquimaris]MQY43359.1 hypothetical protein [Tritonibacter aquimaris]
MSDPVEHAGVEDVLSSIRRLVSDETRMNAENRASRGRVRSPAPRLVLTPALRVMEEDAPAAAEDIEQTGDAQAGDAQADDADQDVSQTQDIPSAEDASFKADAALSQEEPWKEPGATLFQAALNPNDGETATRLNGHVRDANGANAFAGSTAPERNRAAAVVKKIAEMEAANDAAEDEIWEPDASATAPFADAAKQVPQFVRAEAHSAPEQDAPVEPLQQMLEEDTTEAVVTQLEATEDTAVVDEEMLREMVVDIVRSELQGALGERVTRNVRKLVRREIQRALAAHNLD